jgi:hypothetical protein
MWIRLLILSVFVSSVALGHDVPSQLPDPTSTAEAWNVVQGSAANIDRLLDENLLRDITFQIANTDSSLRYLAAHSGDAANPREVRDLILQLLAAGSDLIASIRDTTSTIDKIRPLWLSYRKKLAAMESNYTADLLHSDIYICPMHPLDRHLKAEEKCTVCGMSLIRRRLPASGVYEKPGEPTMKMSVIGPPLVVGRLAQLRIRLTKRDGSPVLLDDLLEMHTRKIHLLINDLSLGDYHHEHPTATDMPGEYAFSFTPQKPGPYRIWADLVPATSSIQEYVIADAPADTTSDPLIDRKTVSTAIVNGRTYRLAFTNSDMAIHAGQTIVGTIMVNGTDGKTFTQLEPVMGAFAHVVGFNQDLKTVLHIHPYSKQPSGPTDRAGPVFAFKFYAPKPGFYRLYGQVQIDGISQFPPFGLTVLPAERPATQPTTNPTLLEPRAAVLVNYCTSAHRCGFSCSFSNLPE